LNAKETEFAYEINSFYDKEIEKLRPQVGKHSFAREFLRGKIDDYEAITIKTKPFELLEEDLGTSFGIIQETLNLKGISQMEEVFQHIKASIDLKLSHQLNALEKIGIWSEELTSMCQEADLKLNEKLYSRRELEKYKADWNYSPEINDDNYERDIIIDGDRVVISYPFLRRTTLNLDVLNDIKDISTLEFRIRRIAEYSYSEGEDEEETFERMSQEDISTLCYIRSRLGELKQIEIVSEEILTLDEALLNVFSCLFWKNDSLIGIHLTLNISQEFDESISYLAEKVLPTTTNLNNFRFHFEQGYISNDACESLSQSLSQRAQNLTSLYLVFQSLEESSLKKFFVSMPNLEVLVCQISCVDAGSNILDEKFISDTLPSLTKLKSFEFFMNNIELNSCTLKELLGSLDCNVKELLSSFPKEWFFTLNHFRLNLSNTQATDESLKDFIEITMKKFKALKTFAINTHGSNISSEMKKKISLWEKKISQKLSSV